MLTCDQARFFARNGYVQVPGVVDARTCRRLVERTWQQLPPQWRREDPDSWRGTFADSCHEADLASRGGLLKYQCKDLAADPHVVAAYQRPSPVHELAWALVGTPLHAIRVRGLYAIAPSAGPQARRRAFSPHVESHPAHLVVLTYLEDVAPGGGGLSVWPGSHRDLWHAFDSKLEHAARPDLATRIAHWSAHEPIELPGRAGDVVLTHHRLLHSPSVNSRSRIRFAFLCDYTALDYQQRCQEAPGPDMWEDWPGLRRLAGDGLTAPSEFTLAPVARLPLLRRSLAWLRRVVGAPAASTIGRSEANKCEASRLARSKRSGDIWLVLSDRIEGFERNHTLDPQGSDLTALGMQVQLNGRRLVSATGGGFTAKLQARCGRNELKLLGVRGPLWLRVLAIRLPFAASEVLLRFAIDGGDATVRAAFEAPAGVDAIGGGSTPVD